MRCCRPCTPFQTTDGWHNSQLDLAKIVAICRVWIRTSQTWNQFSSLRVSLKWRWTSPVVQASATASTPRENTSGRRRSRVGSEREAPLWPFCCKTRWDELYHRPIPCGWWFGSSARRHAPETSWSVCSARRHNNPIHRSAWTWGNISCLRQSPQLTLSWLQTTGNLSSTAQASLRVPCVGGIVLDHTRPDRRRLAHSCKKCWWTLRRCSWNYTTECNFQTRERIAHWQGQEGHLPAGGAQRRRWTHHPILHAV